MLFIGHATDRTGPPIYLLQFLRWLHHTHPEVRAAVLAIGGGELEPEFQALYPTLTLEGWIVPDTVLPGLRLLQQLLHRLHRPGLARRVWDHRWRALQRRKLADLAPSQVVYVNTAGSVALEPLLPHRDHTLISHVHELDVGFVFHLQDRLRRRILRRSSAIHTVSGAVEDNLVERHGVDRRRLTRHPGMVVIEDEPAALDGSGRRARRLELGLAPDAVLVGSSGVTIWRKAPDVFVRMMWELRRRRPEVAWQFVWVGGDHVGIADLRGLAADAGVDDLLLTPGPQPNPLEWFSALDIFVLPAREDAFPLVCLETLAVGVPVIAFDNGGIPEVLAEGCGLVAEWPDVGQLADLVSTLVDDPALRTKMGACGAELIRNQYAVDVLAPKLWADIARWSP